MRPLTATLAALALCLACSPNPNEGPVGPTNCAAPPAQDGGVSAVVTGNSELGIDLFAALAPAADGGNVFFSPYSVSSALAMTYAGASGTTATQMATVLHFGADPIQLAAGLGSLGCRLIADGAGPDGGQLDIANAVFGQKGASFEPAYLSLLQTDLGAALQPVDFAGAPDAARQTIDAWVSEQTRGKIPELLAPGSVDSSMKIALADALYFTGGWQIPFDPSATRPASFTTASGQTVQAPMMSGDLNAGYVKGAGFAALELSFQGASVAMDFILPDSAGGLPQLEAGLSAASFAADLAQLTRTQVSASIPKLQLDTKLDLIPVFKQLGLAIPFDPEQADFSGIDGQRDLSISLIRHEGVLEVDEVGATAAAATVVGISGLAAEVPPPTSFVADHPFVVLIRDLPTGTLLFLGQVTDPTQP
ncbi:MAG: serpin family protein [Deltaproteobacteria bacterium]